MKVRKFILLIVLLFLISSFLKSENESINTKEFEFIHNFPSIRKLYQDPTGYIWIVTAQDLYKYDGYRFKKYPLTPTLYTLPGVTITDLVGDKKGNLWITTFGNGLYKFDSILEKYLHFKKEQNKEDLIPSNFLSCIINDKNNILWIGSYDSGLIRYDSINKVFKKFKHNSKNPDSISSNSVTSICRTSEDNFWIGTIQKGICFFDKSKNIFKRHELVKNVTLKNTYDNIISCLFWEEGYLWIGTRVNGLYRFDLKSKQLDTYHADPSLGMVYTYNYISFIQRDRQGKVWIGTGGGGLYNLDDEEKKLIAVNITFQNNKFISTKYFHCFLEDQSGNLWIGTMPGSLSRMNRIKNKFSNYFFQSSDYKDFRVPVFSIFEDEFEELWLGTNGEGLIKFNRNTGKFKQFKSNPARPDGISGNYVNNVFKDNSGNLFLGIFNSGLDILKRKDSSFKHLKFKAGDLTSLGSNFITSIFQDSKQKIWIGTHLGGLNLYHPQSDSFTRFKINIKDSQIPHGNHVRCIFEDSKHNLLLGLYNGICVFDEKNQFCKNLIPRESNGGREFSDYVQAIYEDKNQDIWIGTFGKGVYRFNPLSGELINYTTKNGLAHDIITGILEDNQKNIWISSYGGISQYNFENDIFINYNRSDGLSSHQMRKGIARCKNGELIFGAANGIIGFSPQTMTGEEFYPKISVTDIRQLSQGNKKFEYNRIKQKLTCNYRDSFIISFSNFRYRHPEKDEYSYFIKELTDSWINLGSKNEVVFSHLKPGDYTFQVKGAASGGIGSTETASLRLVVTPPFWQTWWFKLITILILSITFIIWYRNRIKKVTERIKTEIQFNSYCTKKKLTNREQEVLTLALKGKTNKDIEDILFLSMGTIKVYMHNIYRKLEVKNRIELIKLFEKMKIE